MKNLFFSLLTIQIALSIVKVFTVGMQESIVGSIAYEGGGPATIIPVLGFILVWLVEQGEIKKKDWYYIIFLIFIAYVSFKRAIWFLMPTFIIIFMYYIPKKIKASHLFYVLPLVPVIFYAGVRLNPTLNAEGKIGGSFDLHYVLEYTQKYNFGKTSETPEIQLGTGRGGATFLLIGKLFDSKPLSFEEYIGKGLQEIYTTTYEDFNEKRYGVNSKGAVTGIFQSYIVSGYIGVFLTVLLIIAICYLIKEPRFRNAIALLMFWDYLFYIGLILRTQALFVLLFFIILYSNYLFEQRLYKRYQDKGTEVIHGGISPLIS